MFDKLKNKFKKEIPVEETSSSESSMLEGFSGDTGGTPISNETSEVSSKTEKENLDKIKKIDQLSRQRLSTSQSAVEKAAMLAQQTKNLEEQQKVVEAERRNKILAESIKKIEQYPAVSGMGLNKAFRAEEARAYKRAMGGNASESDKYELQQILKEAKIYGADEELLVRITNLRKRMEGRTVGSAIGRGIHAGSELAKRGPAVGGSMMRYAGRTARPLYDEGLLQRRSYLDSGSGGSSRSIGPARILSPNRAFGMFATPKINIPRQGERQTYMPNTNEMMDYGGSASNFSNLSTGRTQQFSHREMTSTNAINGIFGSGRQSKYNRKELSNTKVLHDLFG